MSKRIDHRHCAKTTSTSTVSTLASHLIPHRLPVYRRPWLVMGCIFLFCLGVLVYVYYFRDDPPPPDASDLLPTFAKQAGADNPLATFCRAMEQHNLTDWDVPEGVESWEEASERVLQAYVDKHAPARLLFDELMRTDPSGWRWQGVDQSISSKTTLSELNDVFPTVAFLGKTEILLLERAGRHEEAVEKALDFVRFGKRLIELDGALIHHLVAITVYSVGLEQMKTALLTSMDQELLRHAQEALTSCEVSSQALAKVLRVEFLYGKNSPALSAQQMMEAMMLSDRERLLVAATTLPNRTTAVHNEHTQRLIRALETDWATGCLVKNEIASANELPDPRWKLLLYPNAGGRIRIAHFDANRLHLISKSCAGVALQRMTIVSLAMRRYELSHGKLPGTLQELIPAFLPTVPTDPFDGQPLRWEHKRSCVYSVSADQQDNRGLHQTPQKVNALNPDFVMPYWWLPEHSEKK